MYLELEKIAKQQNLMLIAMVNAIVAIVVIVVIVTAIVVIAIIVTLDIVVIARMAVVTIIVNVVPQKATPRIQNTQNKPAINSRFVLC